MLSNTKETFEAELKESVGYKKSAYILAQTNKIITYALTFVMDSKNWLEQREMMSQIKVGVTFIKTF